MNVSRALAVPSAATFFLAALSLTPSALADTVVDSGVSATTYSGAPAGFAGDTTPSSGTAVVYTGTSPYSVGNYAAPATGSFYITYDNSTEYLPSGNTTYTVTFQGAGSGTLLFAADDSATATLNGTYLGTAPGFSALSSDPVTLLTGTNTLVFVVTNDFQPDGAANPTALDFSLVASVASTPEPSSLILLGTGLVGLAGATRRKLRKS